MKHPEQAQELRKLERIEECKRIVAGAPWYSKIERSVAERMLATIYKEAK